MILSQNQIEDIAEVTLNDFRAFFFRDDSASREILPTYIDQFAREFLGLSVRFEKLSCDGSLCGITAYADTEYVLSCDGVSRTIPIKHNEVLLDSSFMVPGQVRNLCGKRRFTLAHECAHQLLFHMDDEAGQIACRRMYSERRAYPIHVLKNKEDWNEWQANALGAALLLPRRGIQWAINRCNRGRPLLLNHGQLCTHEEILVASIASFFGASKTAVKIRLKRLGLLECVDEKPCQREEAII